MMRGLGFALLALPAAVALGAQPVQRPVTAAQTTATTRAAVVAARSWTARHHHEILRELAALLAIPNVARDSANILRNAQHLVAMLERRGVRARILSVPGGAPAVYGELPAAGATRTVVLYAHFDGQPVDSAQWALPPWRPTLRTAPLNEPGQIVGLEAVQPPGGASDEWRLYARSASDDKSPIVAMLAALDALRAGGLRPSVNLKFFLEGEEEAGSPHLREMLRAHARLLAADAWIFGDGPVDQSRRRQVVFGVRGVMGAELTVYGPIRPLHSGHYGNWAPNPAVMLAQLLASMRDDEGRVLIAGFGDGLIPPTGDERAAVMRSRETDQPLRRELAIGRTEGSGLLLERIMQPALNVRGLQSGAVGERAANAIPTEARASIDIRLVPSQLPARVRGAVDAHLRRQGYTVLDRAPTVAERLAHAKIARVEWEEGYPAYRLPLDEPLARGVARIARDVAPDVVLMPTLGGSLPMHLFAEETRAPLAIVPIVNHDNNQHAANENLRLRNLWDGIEMYAALIASLGPALGPRP